MKRLNLRINNKGSDVNPAIDREFTQSFWGVMRVYKNEHVQVQSNLCYMKVIERRVAFRFTDVIKLNLRFLRGVTHVNYTRQD